MTHGVTVPKLGLTMEEGTIVEWFHADGAEVRKGEPLFSIETDKIVSEIEAEHDGFLQRVAVINATLPIGGVVGYLHPSAEAARAALGEGATSGASSVAPPALVGAAGVASDNASPRAAAPAVAATASGNASHGAAGTAAAARLHRAALALPGGKAGRVLISPVARTLAATRGVDAASIAGSGPGGVILKRDIEAAASASRVSSRSTAANASPTPVAAAGSAVLSASASGAQPQRRPLSTLRKAIAERMMRSLVTTAQMTGFGKVDMTEAIKLRDALAVKAQALGTRVTYTDIALKAAATVLAEMPELNSCIDGAEIVTWPDVNIGLAVAVDDGLIVPVIRNVDRLTFAEVARQRKALVDKARAGRLARADVEGATFTLSNFGSYGGDFETPILNPPQSALLGIGRIEDTPVVRDGQIVIRPVMGISLTFDHRLIDGAVAGRFRARFKALLENPALWMAAMP